MRRATDRLVRRSLTALTALALAGGCAGMDPGEPTSDETTAAAATHELSVPAIDVSPGEETIGRCFSMPLNNDEPLFVSAVEMNAGPAWHHSNWFYVPDSFMPGPGGLWDCEERDFDTVATTLAGGILFAQSVQVTHEEQRFPGGAVIEIPPHSQIVGDLHLLNASDQPVTTDLNLQIETVEEDQAATRLQPLGLGYFPLALPPGQASSFVGDCDLETPIGAAADFSIYYVLPHYHSLGTGIKLEVVGGPRDGEVVFSNQNETGETWGQSFDTPFDLQGATGLRFSCDYMNPTDDTVGWGFADGEMCAIGAYIDGPFRLAGMVADGDTVIAEGDPEVHSGPCRTAAFL